MQLPSSGQVVRVRQRTWLVRDVIPGNGLYESPRVDLACLDDDAAGELLSVLWKHEIDAEVRPDTPSLLTPGATLDPPEMFGAYLHALRWNTVTSTEKKLLQAPFRAGIDLKAYQLEPLRKALELPRVNLFIADDVGLGKTIEAGLVLQELILRQRIDRVFVVCPAAVTRQWQEELDQRFGLPFALYNRDFVTARRRERGFSINPWTTHTRFVVSYTLLRGTKSRGGRGNQHLELLLGALGEHDDRSLLIVDECHQVAPAGGSLYPRDSRTTRAIRELASRFEHRLFLSATPHNGHSHSFSSLLHLLDPQRFTRGVKVASASELAPIMVRRLKRHLRGTVSGLPERVLVDHTVDEPDTAPAIRLGHLLADYDQLYRACLATLPKKQAAARALVIVNLHKRLLSSVTAFHHTLRLHAEGAKRTLAAVTQQSLDLPPARDGELSDTEQDEAEDEHTEAASFDAGERARDLLDEMLTLASTERGVPDGRVKALAAWLNENLCPNKQWNHRRVVIFTEYQHTLGWLRRTLPPLLQADTTHRISAYSGQQNDDTRDELKKAFNTKPDAHPLRILLATDAAREGINLQAHCADLFHFDLPWNPSRVEQRNGRIDRVLQPSPQVRCHYFHVPTRPEDKVLTYLVRKLHRIREELGSLSAVISTRLAERLEQGLRDVDEATVDDLARPDDTALAAQQELEGDGADQLRGDLDRLDSQLLASHKHLGYRPEHLQEVVDLGLRLLGDGAPGLTPIPGQTSPPTFTLPPLDPTWTAIVDPMRDPTPRADGKPGDVRPIAFKAAHRLDADTVQLHLGHPLVKRLLARFRAQGFAAHDLSRVTALHNPRDPSRRVVMFGRLALFGRGATRLHEALVAVAARCTRDGLKAFAGTGEATTIQWLDDALIQPEPLTDPALTANLRGRVKRDLDALWPRLQEKGDDEEASARDKLSKRGLDEAQALRAVLERQRKAIHDTFIEHEQLVLTMEKAAKAERAQFERDRRAMTDRLDAIDRELKTEPRTIQRHYDVVLTRFEPVGLAYLWPASG